MILGMSKVGRLTASIAGLAMLMVSLAGVNSGRAVAATAPGPSANQPDNFTWSSRIDISQGSIAVGPGLAMRQGDAHIDYSLGNATVKNVYVARSADSGHSWGAGVFEGCTNGSTAGTTTVKVAEDTSRNVYLVWSDYCLGTRYLFLRKYTFASSSWGPIHQLTTFNANGGAVAVGPNGVIYVSYVHVITSGSNAQVEYILSTNGGSTFSAPTPLTDASQYVNSTSIAVDSGSQPHIVYDRGSGSTFQIFAQDFYSGGWHLTTLYTGRGFYPILASNSHGGVGAVWQINDAGVEAYYKRWYPTSHQWDTVSTNVSNTAENAFNPAITYDEQDRAYVTWAQTQGGSGLYTYFSYETSIGVWSARTQVESSRSTAMQMASWNNNIGLAYQYDGSGDWRVYFRWIQAGLCSVPFTDIQGNIFYGAIEYLYCHGAVNGTGGTNFTPSGTSTRGQFAKVVVVAFGIAPYTPVTPDFTDVPPTYFAYNYVEAGFHAGVLSGYDPTTCSNSGAVYPCYLPNTAITRGQITKLVVNAAHYTLINPPTPTYSDVPYGSVFYQFVETAHSKSVVNGYPDNTFRPNNPITRDQMCSIVYKGVTTP